jgi:hypothetical protein
VTFAPAIAAALGLQRGVVSVTPGMWDVGRNEGRRDVG